MQKKYFPLSMFRIVHNFLLSLKLTNFSFYICEMSKYPKSINFLAKFNRIFQFMDYFILKSL